MKVSFITKHSVSNYGSILQTYATQEILKKLGCEPEIINYMRYDLRNNKLYNTLLKNQPKWNKNFLTRTIYRIIQMPNYILMDSKFKKFRKKMYDNTTILYGSNEELKKNPPRADVYCTGSDQIWGKNVNGKVDKAYFLDFVPEGSRCISYAASIGLDKVSEEFEKQLQELLKKYQKIMVREESAVDILKRNNIESTLVLDPTLLLDKEDWEKVSDKKKNNKKYILIYQLHANKNFEKYAKEFSKKVGLPLIRVTPSINQISRCGKFKYLPTPGQFLRYFRDASYVITDSFHGTVFSIIFNRKFIDISPGETATRIKNILKLVDLEERLLKDYSDFSLIDREIDWNKVNKILKEEKDKSIELLKNAIYEEKKNKNVDEMNKNRCTGCRACEQICPVGAISMIQNEEGFIEPKVNKDKCINCGKCVQKCPQLNEKELKNELDVYAVKLKNSKEQLESSSGGAFVAIAKEVLKDGGVIYGCAFSENLEAKHIKVDNEKDLIKLKGSKYVQSDTGATFKEVKIFLENSRMVLYSGTPCQIAGLKAFLGKEYKNLITVDFICHGVPSPKLFKKYKEWLEKKNKAKLNYYNFRDKEKNLWGLNSKMIFSKNGKNVEKYQKATLDPYYKSFLKGYTYRECCYNCLYANPNRISDFTIADYWGIEKEHPEFQDEKGVSMLMVNNEKAKRLFEKNIREQLEYVKSTVEKAAKKNLNLNRPFTRPKQRNYAYANIDTYTFDLYAKKSLNFKKDLKDVITDKLPKGLKKKIKNIIGR